VIMEAAVPVYCHVSEDFNFCFCQILQPVSEDSKTNSKFEVLAVVMLKI